MPIRIIAKDPLFLLVAVLAAVLIATSAMLGPSRDGSAPGDMLTGTPSGAFRTDDPALNAIVNGTFPRLAPGVTLGQAFERYRWFKGPAKWMSRGPAASRTVLVSVPLELPGQPVKLGIGSDAASVFYAAEFGFSGDGKSFLPLSSAIEVRNASNKVLQRVPDTDYTLLRRVLRNAEPGASLERGISKDR
ncbi:MAG: hypothetical protein ACOZEN_07805 [Thermodesulfobacteriota bacterium]